MRDYRLFRFDQLSGLASETRIRAADDAEAREIMHEKAKGADCELWHGDKLIDFVSGADR